MSRQVLQLDYAVPMSTRQEIEIAIAQLPPQEFRELLRWIDAVRADAWDRQLEEDAASGKLDRFFAELENENTGQSNISLDDFLDQSELPKTL